MEAAGACTNTTASPTPFPSGPVTVPDTEGAPTPTSVRHRSNTAGKSFCRFTSQIRVSVTKPITELPTVGCRVQWTRRVPMTGHPDVLEREPVPQADQDEIRGRHGMAVLVGGRNSAVQIADPEPVVS